MRQLLEDEARCTGRYDLSTFDLCPDRGYCLRYQQLLADRRRGRVSYKDTLVTMADKECGMFVEAENEKIR